MKQVLIKKGKAYTEEVPAPLVNENTVLVQVKYSCISTGTETSAVAASSESMLRKVLRKPEIVGKAIDSLKKEGFLRRVQRAQRKLEEGVQTGYSASGVIIDVGENIKGVEIGDRVACAGAG
ncbi:MAG: hypothetical protein JSV56_11530, partial [Methanomassiliicoccales archaeon]